MRITSLAAGLAIVLAACGGEKKADEQPATPPADQTAAPAPGGEPAAPAPGGGTTHNVDMVLDGSAYKYVPDKLTIKAGDVVRFHSKSGGAHNVQFYPDSIPANVPGPIKALAIAPPEKGGSIASESMKTEGETFDLSFAGAPTGDYKMFCAPHHALGMKGQITVQ
ncbi:MAG TPA: plastocyanin/azurin family copper-binding protein [Gemmatimonadales bacterium]|nr:plastocyanin/azurin family copper-binding protein [Gemmatimonadales bacterium]